MINIAQENTEVNYKLTDLAKTNGCVLNNRKSKNIEIAKIFYEKSNKSGLPSIKKRANRIFSCNLNRFLLISNDYAFNIFTNRCRDRHCPDCQKVRSYIWQDDIMNILPTLTKERDNDGFLFLTLTVNNPFIEQLSNVMNAMSIAFKRMMQYDFRESLIGGIRTFEITRGNTTNKRCHPHIHALIQVKNSYFKHHYISKKTLSEIWLKRISNELNKKDLFNPNDYNSGIIVDISRVISSDSYEKIRNKQILKKDLKKSDYLDSKNININNNGQKVINYVLKYSTKESEIFNGDSWSFEYDKQTRGKRLIATFGSYKSKLAEYRKNKRFSHYNESKFLDNLKCRSNINNIKDSNVYYCTYDNEYLASGTTLATALYNKRRALVEKLEKSRTESFQLYLFANITDRELDERIKKYNDTPTSIHLNHVNEMINSLNIKRENERKMHQRLVDHGHRIMIDEHHYYISGDAKTLYNTFSYCAEIERINPTEKLEISKSNKKINFLDDLSLLPF